jgi:predicted DsbA family dithiol-disulfide isomerase
MAESSLDSLRKTRDVAVEWRAYELSPDNLPPIPPEVEAAYQEKIARSWPQVQQVARERFGLELRRMEGEGGRRSTRLAHVGAKFALAHGQAEAWNRAIFRAHWQELRDISSADSLAEIAVSLGLEETAFRAALADPDYVSAVETDEYWAWQQDLRGVPAFIFCQRYLVSGAQPPETLERVVDKCIEEGRSL